ncbi:hypothetical protein ACF0H5_008156 [Mactra antiquata]
MTVQSLNEALKYQYDGKPTLTLQRKAFKYCKDELNMSSSVVKTLKALCRLQILEQCAWKSTDIVKLPIPNALKRFINRVE